MSRIETVLAILEGVNLWSAILRITLATLIGGIIGLDRGRHGRVAGARTHILVCLGAAVTTLVGFYTAEHLGFANDPLRMGAQVISGVGFLGVGTIVIRHQSQVKGLTTAAGLWTTACLGLAIGAGFYLVALLAFGAVMLTITVLARLEQRAGLSDNGSYYVELEDMRQAKEFYNSLGPEVTSVELVAARSGLPGHVGMELVVPDPKQRHDVMAQLQSSERVAIALPLHT